jgi:hypothetical protein
MIISFNYYLENELIKNNFIVIIENIAYMLSFLCDICLDESPVTGFKLFKYDIFRDKFSLNKSMTKIDKTTLIDGNNSILHFAWSYLVDDNELYCNVLSKPLSVNFFEHTIQQVFNSNCTSNDIFENGLLHFPYRGKNISINSIYGFKNTVDLTIDNSGIHSYLTNLLDKNYVYPMFGKKSLTDNVVPLGLNKPSYYPANKTFPYPQNILDMFDIAQKIDPIK